MKSTLIISESSEKGEFYIHCKECDKDPNIKQYIAQCPLCTQCYCGVCNDEETYDCQECKFEKEFIEMKT